VRRGATSPRISQARSAEEEIPTRLATSLMRSQRGAARIADLSHELIVLDTVVSFL
jgi:hypothetical protein